jgi:hypothetical protein
MHIFFEVLSALLCARFIEWVIVAAIKEYHFNKKNPEL